MGIKDMIQRFGEKGKARRELLHQIDQQVRMEKIIADRQLSSNERELNRLRNEEREEFVKEELDFRRKQRDNDIKFGHNPLDTPNITNHVDWEVLKEKNMFANNNNVLEGHGSVLKNNKNLLKQNKKLLQGGNMFKI